MIKDPVERLLYIALVVIFIAIGVFSWIAINLEHKLDSQLKQLKQVNKDQAKTIVQLKDNQEQIKASALKNTRYLECIINLHSKGLAPDEGNCSLETQNNQLAGDPPPTGFSAPVVPQPANQSPPAAPPSGPLQKINDVLSSVEKVLGL